MNLVRLKPILAAVAAVALAGAAHSATYQYRQYLPGFVAKPVTPVGSPLTYAWQPASWGSCSCATNTQSRTVSCVASDGTAAADSSCTDTKPAESQSCTPATGACDINGTPLATGASAYTVDAQGDLITAVVSGSGMTLNRYQGTNLVSSLYQACNPVFSRGVILPDATGHLTMGCAGTTGTYNGSYRISTVTLQVFNPDFSLAATKAVTGYAAAMPTVQMPYLSTIQLTDRDGYSSDTIDVELSVAADGTLTQTWVNNVNNNPRTNSTVAYSYAEGHTRTSTLIINGTWSNSDTYGYCSNVQSPVTSTRYYYCRWVSMSTGADVEKTCLHTNAGYASLQYNHATSAYKCFTLPSDANNFYDIPFIDSTGTLYSMRGSTVYRITSGF